ncbi:glycosyltransferase [Gloeocapsopsis dulcis]|uniref:Family 2 glycosyl transferase n=1 Tax=Gloeocapsopsis dulcis AAB1 = 1H9 TaxID=1433147 RepID=A0A6N8FZG6_9CHRO|nr:glycosyltransferase [Gloeocapsopsis dulcis]MUL37296.1 family 2 glycosyl transferase [Gloeocapsopsis dulcis AAB1 = 1H9]WNN91100.1 glycosyltransferase [Gloeocapsopsis dulcis]
MTPLVSIIIPTFNAEKYIKEAIESAISQSWSNKEIIAVDDGSTDHSLEIIRSFGDRIRWETGINQGAPISRNRGLELAQGEYIKFLDADDVLLLDCIEKQVAQVSQLSSDSKAIVYGDAMWVDRNGDPIPNHPLRARQPAEDPIAHILAQCPLTSCPLHKREYLLEIGGFDSCLPRGQEHDLHLRLVLAGVKFVHHPGFVYQYREYSDGDRISKNAYSKKGAMIYYNTLQRHKKLIEAQTGQTLAPEVRKILSQRFWMYGRSILREGYITEANQYFSDARQLDAKHCMVGSMPYPALVKLFGTKRAESMLQNAKSLLKSTAI